MRSHVEVDFSTSDATATLVVRPGADVHLDERCLEMLDPRGVWGEFDLPKGAWLGIGKRNTVLLSDRCPGDVWVSVDGRRVITPVALASGMVVEFGRMPVVVTRIQIR